jgi:hypothetical protein
MSYRMRLLDQLNRKYVIHTLSMRDFVLRSNLHRPETRAASPLSIFLLVSLPTSVSMILSLVDLVTMAAWRGQHDLDNVLEIGHLIAMLVEGEKEPGKPNWKRVGRAS